MANKRISTPENMSIEEASEFWDNHSIADFQSQIVQLDYTQKKSTTFIAVDDNLLPQLDKQATAQGISIEKLINLWVKEKIAS